MQEKGKKEITYKITYLHNASNKNTHFWILFTFKVFFNYLAIIPGKNVLLCLNVLQYSKKESFD